MKKTGCRIKNFELRTELLIEATYSDCEGGKFNQLIQTLKIDLGNVEKRFIVKITKVTALL